MANAGDFAVIFANIIRVVTPEDRKHAPFTEVGVFLTPKVLLVGDVGESNTHVIRKQLPDVSLIYPWSRPHLAELLAGSDTVVRVIARDVTNGFKVVMSPYYKSENNPHHIMMDQEALMLIRMAF
jgi:hypothetical protein